MTINVKKRDGELEPLNLDKIHRVLGWACEDITGVSVSEIELKSHLKFSLYSHQMVTEYYFLLW